MKRRALILLLISIAIVALGYAVAISITCDSLNTKQFFCPDVAKLAKYYEENIRGHLFAGFLALGVPPFSENIHCCKHEGKCLRQRAIPKELARSKENKTRLKAIYSSQGAKRSSFLRYLGCDCLRNTSNDSRALLALAGSTDLP